MMEVKLRDGELKAAKVSFACRRVNLQKARLLLREPYSPQAGDVVLAEIERIGQHKRIELVNGRRALLAEGDRVILSYGNRYAPDQFEGLVPHNLAVCDMVAAGGIAATAVARNLRMDPATRIRPLGVLADAQGRVLNLADFSLPAMSVKGTLPPVFVVCGTSMNAGKTHAACSLVTGLSAMGYRVGATKLTGTGAGGDVWRMIDAGASKVLDFTDAGLPSTYLEDPQTLIEASESLLANLAAADVDVIVAEIADGLGHAETCALLESERLQAHTHGVLFAAGDSLGASAGFNWLLERQLPVLGISGALTLSPLAIREVRALVPVEPITAQELASPRDLRTILPGEVLPSAMIQAQVKAIPAAAVMLPANSAEICGPSVQ
ncbi:molybdopterin-guanine dinucleotide biosynthesis protein B [Exilibacterium tricleocarpae]|uniref:Molybdopterin-guanine dinucleotide biosynthesis protein B n=1 Tax=Exilibacterium tricleocarpae TaxID=2591008 RepID=A0A545U9Z6_9GAMM|nr:molybdopterin-guanine dinucleotide biosynthesis protein B [Exilibacterium tricleocarpae]TQV86233.1 molybdopterin-guanine dinucleotide biosynthesis protein B [Exilibacterium tricleocarpae]